MVRGVREVRRVRKGERCAEVRRVRNVRKVPEWAAILGLVIFMTPGALGAGQQPSAAADKPAAAAAAARRNLRRSLRRSPKSRPSSRTTSFMPAEGRCATRRRSGGCPSSRTRATSRPAIFYMAYTLDGRDDAAQRPLMFSFNGGPGSSSVWLHLGALGPRRVKMLDDGGMPAPPYELVDNEQTWLDRTDLVFIDPVGTGYSRAAKPELGIEILEPRRRHRVGRRVHPPVSDALRALGVAAVPRRRELRHDARRRARRASRSIAASRSTASCWCRRSSISRRPSSAKGNDLPYVLYLPTYTATAWYHKKLAPDLQADLAVRR